MGPKIKSFLFQLPVPIAVLVLMYYEKVILCCPNSPPHLTDNDELAMETNTAECPEAQDQESGGTDKEQSRLS